ncbi:MAG: hypothetical protein WD469_00815 [Paenibacillaceae bacterium]
MLYLMYDNVVIAKREGNEGNYSVALETGVKPFFIPNELFRGKDHASMLHFIDWIADRIFPKNRVGADRLLSEMGLDTYSIIGVARQTKACLMEDGFWVAFSEEDDFRRDTIRGQFNFPDLAESDYLFKETKG